MIRALREAKFVFGRKYFAPTEKLSRLSREVRELGTGIATEAATPLTQDLGSRTTDNGQEPPPTSAFGFGHLPRNPREDESLDNGRCLTSGARGVALSGPAARRSRRGPRSKIQKRGAAERSGPKAPMRGSRPA